MAEKLIFWIGAFENLNSSVTLLGEIQGFIESIFVIKSYESGGDLYNLIFDTFFLNILIYFLVHFLQFFKLEMLDMVTSIPKHVDYLTVSKWKLNIYYFNILFSCIKVIMMAV